MQLVQKGEFSDEDDYENPQIPEDYYLAKLSAFHTYDRDDQAAGLIIKVELVEDSRHGEEYAGTELPFFAPAKLSVPRENNADEKPSRLAENLDNLGALEHVLDTLGIKQDVMTGDPSAVASSESDLENLQSAIKEALQERVIRVNVEDNQNGDESQVSKLQKFVDEE